MRKKIQASMLLIIFFSILIYGFGNLFLFFDNERNDSISIVDQQISYIASNYPDVLQGESKYVLDPIISQTRISLIDPDGQVIYDNKFPLASIENHNDRSEVIQAREFKTGTTERNSASLLTLTYYKAVLLDDGNVLRLAIPISSLISIFKVLAPFTFFTLIFVGLHALVLSRKLTNRIVSPIEEVDLKSDLTSPYPELDLYFMAMRDQRDQAEEQNKRILRRNETINMILNTMQEGFLVVDESSSLFLANEAFLNLMGIKEYKVKDPLIRFISDEKLLTKVKQALDGQSSAYKIKLDDKTYQVYINASNLSHARVAILYFVDISLEYENLKYREEFSANVSHELKTPLTIIKGLSELLSNNLVSENDISDFGSKIEKQSDRLLAMIENIIRISQFDEKETSLSQEQVDFKALVFEVKEHLNHKLLKAGIKLNMQMEEVSILANYSMLDEMVYNLLDNAIKYNHENGSIDITLIKKNDSLIFTIANDGVVIESKDRPYIFDRFYLTDQSRAKKIAGSGLGLSIVKHIVQYHKGSVRLLADSRTTIEIELPL